MSGRSGRESLLLTCPETGRSRRELLKRAAALGMVTLGLPWRTGFAQQRTRPTPDQILGPFYPNEKDRLLQGSWAKDSLIAKVLPPTAQEEPSARLVVWDIILIQG